MSATETALHRIERLAERELSSSARKRRMLVIVNPHASTVSDPLKNLVVHALESRYSVEAAETEGRDHATEFSREAVREGYEVVVAFGGDGTVNEAANGLVGAKIPLTCLPGGTTNVFSRTLGIPADVVDATERLLAMADDFRPYRVDTGRANGRHFVFSSGAGLDASVVQRVDRRPRVKARLGAWYYVATALLTYGGEYLLRPPRLRVESAGRTIEGVTAIAQNTDPFTYFGTRPIRLCRAAGLDTGTLSLAMLKRATAVDLPPLVRGLLSSRAATLQRHRQVEAFETVPRARVVAVGDRPFPVHVDGDHIGEFDELEYAVSPRSLPVVA